MTFQPTIPRGPVSAMFTSPGPIYALPPLIGFENHDLRSTHTKGPAYQMGRKTDLTLKDNIPGPKYSFQNQPVYRDGKAGQPNAYMFGRTKFLIPFNAPGPAAYNPESGLAYSLPAPPKYTFGRRLDKGSTDQTPAANTYILPPMLCKTVQSDKIQPPAYTMNPSGRDRNYQYDVKPSPNAYDVVNPNVYLNNPPAYTIHRRVNLPQDNTMKPGPGAHYEERQWMVPKKTAASYSFGMRHSQYVAPLFPEVDEQKFD